MTLPRFFCDMPLSPGQTVALPPAVAQHAGRALRLREGSAIVLFNGQGGEYTAQLQFVQGQAMAQLQAFTPDNRLPARRFALVQGLASGDKMDWIIEKACELGVTEVFTVAAERSVLQLKGERLQKRVQHWQQVALSACEQCGRNIPMSVHAPQSLALVLQQAQDYVCWHASPEQAMPVAQAVATVQAPVAFCVGPEGGWSPKEQQLLAGAQAVTLGERILRTETAGLALAAVLVALAH